MTSNSRRFRRAIGMTACSVAVALGLAVPAAAAGDGRSLGPGIAHPREVERPQDKDALNIGFAVRHGLSGSQASAARRAAAEAATAIPVLANTGQWREVGPKPYHTDNPKYGLQIEGFTVVAGRNPALAVDPTNPDIVWAGAAGGGVWRSTDAGAHWLAKSDLLPSLAVGAIAIDPTTRAVFVGTGEGNVGQDNFAGSGVYRSRDDGTSWQRVDANVADASATTAIAIGGGRIFVATNKGLFRSIDGGDSYQDVVLPTDVAGTAPGTSTTANIVSDVRIHPARTDEITAAVGWRKGAAGGSTGAGLYRSTTGGAPGSFTRMAPTGFGTASISNDPIGRTSLGYAVGQGQDHDIMWAVIEDPGLERGDLKTGVPPPVVSSTLNGVYRSADDGQTWDLKATWETLAASPGEGQGPGVATYGPGIGSWYNQWIAVDPFNAEKVLVGLEEIFMTTAGANTPGTASWDTIGRYWNTCAAGFSVDCGAAGVGPYASATIHPDQHAFAFAALPNTRERLYVGNDGGVYRQDVARGAGYDNANWIQLNNTLGTTQPFYAAMSGDGTVYAGFQDNGTVKIDPTGRADEVYSGDGFDVAVEPDDSNHAYEEYTYGAMNVTKDGGVSWTSIQPSQLTDAQFSTPFSMDPLNKKHLIVGGRQVLETVAGVDTSSWMQAYDLGTNSSAGTPNSVSGIGVRGTNVYVAFCAACDPVVNTPNVDASKFGNGIATNISAGCTPQTGAGTCWHKARAAGLPNRYINAVAMDPNDPRTVWVTLAGYARRWYFPDGLPGAGRGHLFVSHDGGDTFVDVSANLPDAPANALVVRAGRVFVGTDVGVFSAPVTGGAFTRVGVGLPNGYVLDLRTSPDGNTLVAASHGRGVWTLDIRGVVLERAAPKPSVAPRRRRLPATGDNSHWPMALGLALVGGWGWRRRRVRLSGGGLSR